MRLRLPVGLRAAVAGGLRKNLYLKNVTDLHPGGTEEKLSWLIVI